MQADDRITAYMKERNEAAKTFASTIAVQLFALSIYYALYALIAGGVFYSMSEKTGKIVIAVIASVIAVCLAVVNVLAVIKSRKVYITRPDNTALRDSEEIVTLAYDTARPVLIYKITYSLVIVAAAALVYIIFQILMEDQALAVIYGRIIVSLGTAAAVIIALPCIDRIACYRALLGQTHDLYYDRRPDRPLMYTLAVTIPLCILAWYLLRYFGPRGDIAWIVFPAVAIFALAVPFLVNICRLTDAQ